MSKFTIASDQEVLGGATDDTLIEISRVPSLDGQSMSKDVRANSAVPITFSNSDKLGDRCERVARQISPKHSAILGSRTAADMRKAGIECHALSEADEDLTGICLCQPEPKIPRPRNGKQIPTVAAFINFPLSEMLSLAFNSLLSSAFILYRQHRQAQVAAQNPKLTNPEISKVIGEYWRAEPEPIKEQWKAVADVRKTIIMHSRQSLTILCRKKSCAISNNTLSTGISLGVQEEEIAAEILTHCHLMLVLEASSVVRDVVDVISRHRTM